MQSMARNSFKEILNYQDRLTKIAILLALTLKRLLVWLIIYLMSFFYLVLQSDNGSEFTTKVINELK